MSKNRTLQFLPVLLILLLAMYFRYRFNFFQHTINGDGAYFCLQVRNILNHFNLALPDMPLYFYFTAIFAKIITWLQITTQDNAVILAIKILDIVLPALSAIIVYLLARKINENKNKMEFSDYLMVAFSVLFFPFMVSLNGELQKDAIGISLIFLCLFSLYNYSIQNKKWPINILLILALTAFFDFGIFVIMLGLIMLFILFYIPEIVVKLKGINKRVLITFTVLVTLSIVFIYLFDWQRAKRLITFSIGVFDNSVIAFWINGDRPFHGPTSIYVIIINVLSITALILTVTHRKLMDKNQKRFVYSFCIAALMMASPLLNYVIAWRLYIISFVPITFVYLIVFKLQLSKITRGILYFSICFMLIFSMRIGFVAHKRPQMSKEAFAELHSMKEQLKLESNSVTVTTLFVGWWFAWELNTKVCQDYALTKEDFNKYDAVYLLQQTNGFERFGHNFMDYSIKVPKNSELIYQGENFEVYRLNNYWQSKEMPHVAALITGIVQHIDGNQFTIEDTDLHYIIEFNNKTVNLKNGDRVKIWGKGKAFSTHVVASTIVKI